MPSTDSPNPSADLPRPGAAALFKDGLTARAILLGTLVVAGVCAMTPFNDLVLTDMHLSAGFAPLAAFLVPFALIVLINAPLHRFAPKRALRTGELAVIVMMLLVGCSLPSWGLVRFWVPTPVAPFYFGGSDASFWKTFQSLGLPEWLYPVDDVSRGPFSPVVNWFYNAAPAGESPPLLAWLRPMLLWGIFIAAMITTLVSLARLVLPQWADNERLPFPLVELQVALIQPPQPGRALNELFRNRLLWLAMAAVMVIHGMTILSTFFPKQVPQLPIGYDLSGVFADPPMSYLRTKVKAASLSFIVVGVTYFIRSRAAISLWGIYLIINLVDVQAQMSNRSVSGAAWADMHLGACVAFVIGMAYVGRHHIATVIRNSFGRGEKTYRLSFWLAVAGIVVMFAWLAVVGVRPWVSVLIVSFIVIAHLIVTRVVAETGLPFFRCGIVPSQVYTALPHSAISGKDVYFATVFNILGPLTTRDSMMTQTMHGMNVARECGVGETSRVRLGATIAWAFVVGIVVATITTLVIHYNVPTPPTRDISPAGNNFAAIYVQQRDMVNPLKDYATGSFADRGHDPATFMGIGFVVVGALQVLSLRFAGWPFLPVGFVASYGAFIQNSWFSIFVGWLCKSLIVRFGGAPLYQTVRPVFVGLILGEGLIAGGWLIVNAVIQLLGYESKPIQLLL